MPVFFKTAYLEFNEIYNFHDCENIHTVGAKNTVNEADNIFAGLKVPIITLVRKSINRREVFLPNFKTPSSHTMAMRHLNPHCENVIEERIIVDV